MANYANLISSIQAVIKTNGNNEITGSVLQQALVSMINSLGADYQYAGVATPSTAPGSPDQKVFYLAATAGTYSNFGGQTLGQGEVSVLYYNGAWSKTTIYTRAFVKGAGVGSAVLVGSGSQATGQSSVAEGEGNIAEGDYSHAEGEGNIAEGDYSHAEGSSTEANAGNSHAEGNGTIADGYCAHAEGSNTEANGYQSHAEGEAAIAEGESSHAEGYNTHANGAVSHAEGEESVANGTVSHAEGIYTVTNNDNEHAQGKFNKSNTGTIHSIGIGASESTRTNAVEVMNDGRVFVKGLGEYDGTNPTVAKDLANAVMPLTDMSAFQNYMNVIDLSAGGELSNPIPLTIYYPTYGLFKFPATGDVIFQYREMTSAELSNYLDIAQTAIPAIDSIENGYMWVEFGVAPDHETYMVGETVQNVKYLLRLTYFT